MSQRFRLLVFGDDPSVPTGFGQVLNAVLKPLAEGRWEIHICAINYKGDPPDPVAYPYRYYAPYLSPEADFYGIGRMYELVTKVQPDLVFILNDLPIVRLYLKKIEHLLPYVPVVTYSPIDGDPFPPGWLEALRLATKPCVYTDYARRVIQKMDPNIEVTVIPHGHNPKHFYPLALTKEESKRIAAERLSQGGVKIDPMWFIVGRVDKNQERKNWPATIRVFSRFMEDHPDARLYLHTEARCQDGFDIPTLLQMYGVGPDRVLVTAGLGPNNPGIPVEGLNLLYNLFDLHLSTTSGGGWELSTHEAQAAGTPVLATDCSALPEVVHGGMLIPVAYKYTAYRNTVEYCLANEDAAVDLLCTLYEDEALRRDLRERGLAWAREMTWNKPAAQFAALFEQTVREFRNGEGKQAKPAMSMWQRQKI